MSKRIRATSVAALQSVPTTRAAIVLGLVKRSPYPMTAYELARAANHSDPNWLRPRLTELYDDGFVTHAGQRKCEVTGKKALTWIACEPRRVERPLSDATQERLGL